MYRYEDFVNFYRVNNLLACARRDIQNHLASGTFWFWLVSTLGFVATAIGAFSKGIYSFIFVFSGLPLLFAWAIYVSRTPSAVSWRQQVYDYLENKYSQPDWENFLNYISTQYSLEDSKPLWRTGYGVVWLSLAVGQFIGYILDFDKSLNLNATSFMLTSAIAIMALLFFVDNVYPRRKTRLHLAIKDIKKFQANKIRLNS